MLRIIKISGESMSPEYNDGDYVIISGLPLLLGLVKVGSVLVFNSQEYGLLVKKVAVIDKKNRQYYFYGNNRMSLTTEKMGAISYKNIKGYVICHFKK